MGGDFVGNEEDTQTSAIQRDSREGEIGVGYTRDMNRFSWKIQRGDFKNGERDRIILEKIGHENTLSVKK